MPGKFIISIDLGGTNLKVALMDLSYQIKLKSILSTKAFIKKETLIRAIIDSVRDIIKSNALHRNNILGIGLGLPGPIDAEQGIVHFFPNIPGWREVKLKKILEQTLRLPVFLDNDANLMALAEFKLGAAKGLRNAVCLTLGTGVGAGIIIDGSLYRGSTFCAGEIGHMPINEKGTRCNCGGIACLETYIGNNRILENARRLFKRDISLEELSRKAKRHDRLAQGLWSVVGTKLGIALAGVVNLLNPDAIVIGGGVAGAGKILFDKVKEIILNRAMRIQAKHVLVLKAKLGSDAGLIGAAILVKENIF
jgi:glucokinase